MIVDNLRVQYFEPAEIPTAQTTAYIAKRTKKHVALAMKQDHVTSNQRNKEAFIKQVQMQNQIWIQVQPNQDTDQLFKLNNFNVCNFPMPVTTGSYNQHDKVTTVCFSKN